MNFKTFRLALVLMLASVFPVTAWAAAGDVEYAGQFETALAANTEDFERVVFKHIAPERLKGQITVGAGAHLAIGRLHDPQTGKSSLFTLLVEEPGEKNPAIFVDLDENGNFSESEKFPLEQTEKDNPYLWKTTVKLPVKNSFFTVCPLFVQYFKSIQMDGMTEEDRLITQSTEVFARGIVDVKGKKILTQYAFSFENKKLTPQKGWLGIDGNEDGAVDMDELSPEAAKADDETVIFRVGQTYLSTKKTDLSKNQIVLREHEAKDYKRVELAVGKEFPEFAFTDFSGKKRKFSEFRGKYVLLDVWGFWCPPCRKEMPYLREANRRFQSRNLQIIGLNTDAEMPLEMIKKNLEANDMKWTQAQIESIFDFINKQIRIESFPTTFLIAPDGKILSMSRHTRGEPDLRGKDLLETLDEILPAN